MKRAITIITLLVSSVNLSAQTKNPVTTVVKEIVPKQQTNLVAAVEAMPADKFGYKPTPQQMSFAHLVLHMTESNYALCAKASDMPQPKHDAAHIAFLVERRDDHDDMRKVRQV